MDSQPSPGRRRLLLGRLLAVVAIAAAGIFPLTAPTERVLFEVMFVGAYALGAGSLGFIYANGGLLSVAHGALVGLGAFTAVIFVSDFGSGAGLAALAAIGVATVAAIAVGYPSLRLRGHYFLVATFAFSEVLRVVASNLDVTGGVAGRSFRMSDDAGLVAAWLGDSTILYYVILATLVFVFIAFHMLGRTRFVQHLRAIRESEDLARSIGIRPGYVKTIAFALSGAVAGVAGYYWAFLTRYVSPGDVSAHRGIVFILVLLLGGTAHWLGPFVGAAIYVGLPHVTDLSPLWNTLVGGVLLVIVMLTAQDGIVSMVAESRVFKRFVAQPRTR